MTRIFLKFSALVAVLALVGATGAFAQIRLPRQERQLYTPGQSVKMKLSVAGQQTRASTQAAASVPSCLPDETLFSLADWSGEGVVYGFCHNEARTARLLFTLHQARGVSQVLPLGTAGFFAYSDSHLTRVIYSPTTVDSWKTLGGAFVSDPVFNNITLRFPWDGEIYSALLLTTNVAVTNQQAVPFRDSNKLNCAFTAATPARREFCLNPAGWYVFQPRTTFAGPDYQDGQVLFAEQHPVNIATGPVQAGERLFVTMGTIYDYPDTPTPGPTSPISKTLGNLTVVYPGFADSYTTDILAPSQDIMDDLGQQRLAASGRGVYFIRLNNVVGTVVPQVAYYSFAAKKVIPVIEGDLDSFFSGLAVLPQATASFPPLPAPPPRP